MSLSRALSTNNYGPAKFIVAASPAVGTHTTIAAAITDASAGDTIFIRPGTYTENLTLKTGVNLTAYSPTSNFSLPSPSSVIISGKCSYSSAGTVSIANIVLQTNSDYAVEVTGSSASVVILQNCYINCTNNSGLHLTSTSASSIISCFYCSGDLTTTGIALFTNSGAGNLRFLYSLFGNSGSSTTNNTCSSTGNCFPNYSGWANGTTMSSSSSMIGAHLNFTMSGNQTALTTSSTASINIQHSEITGGTSSAISIGAGTSVQLHHCGVSSSNASTIAGTGTLSFTNITFNSGASLAAGLTLSNASMNSFISGAGVGTTGQVFTSNGASSPPTFQTPASSVVVKQVRTSSVATDSTSTAMPADDTIPQNTEGKELFSLAITPSNTNNILLIQAVVNVSVATTQQCALALFQDSTAGALAAQAYTCVSGGLIYQASFQYYMVAGTTSATTFKLRYGVSAGGTAYINQSAGGRLYGGVAFCSMTITELTP